MRKPLLNTTILMIAAVMAVISAQAQITSVNNGFFYYPATWDCMCVPSPHTGQSVIINHAVTLNNDIGVYGGSVTINASGSLTQDGTPRDMHLNNGTLVNHGSLTLDRLWAQNGSFDNQGTATIRTFANEDDLNNDGITNVADSMYNDGVLTNGASAVMNVSTFYNNDLLTNNGQILNVDSMTNSGTFTNAIGAVVEVDSATNTGTFDNSGHFDVWAFTNTGTWDNYGLLDFVDMANFGVFNNHSSIVGTGRFGNFTDFYNLAGASMVVNISFINADQYPAQPNGTVANFRNHGTVDVGDSWYNFAIVQGDAPGAFTVQDSTVNYGSLIGTFDLCDLTPTVTTPPIIDHDFGTADLGITYCDVVTGFSSADTDGFSMFPNPASGQVALNLPDIESNVRVRILDAMGRCVMDGMIVGSSSATLDVSGLSAGIYAVMVDAVRGKYSYRLMIH
ncbi:MAG: T9SS type A sorting domain-containing protein [Flavobacteriales bacterium]|nr:T9SS type A sorting domain-containing protein [Flavobacteriales bacterium]